MLTAEFLDGYEPPVSPDVLVDDSARMDDPVFWAAFLYAVGGSESAVTAFDVDPADVDVLLTELHAPETWSYYCLPMGGGTSLQMVFRNYEFDSGWDYVFAMPSGRLITLAQLEGHFRGPGLSWHEVVTAAGLPDPGAEPARRLLLMLPAATGDVDLPEDAVQTVAAALTTVGAVRDQAETAAELLGGDERFWGTSRWRERDGMSVNQGGHSVRNPSELSSDDLRIVAEALRGKW